MSAQEEAKPAAVNAVITSPNSQETAEAIKNAKSGLTGYETDEQLAAIASGQTPESVRSSAEQEQVQKITQAEEERKIR